jgi:hypothetical protein
MPLLQARDGSGNRKGCRNLRRAKNVSPNNRCSDDLLRYNDYVAGVEFGRENVVVIPSSGAAADY